MAILTLAAKSLWNRRLTSALVVFAIALSVILLLGVERLRTQTRASFAHTLSDTDLIVGARGSPINLLLYSVFRIGDPTNNVDWSSYRTLAADPQVAWTVPLSLGDSHRGFRVLGTDRSYFAHYHYGRHQPLQLAEGREFEDLFDAVLGAEVAEQLGYQLGQSIVLAHGAGEVSFALHQDKPFRVVGILARTGTPVDRTVHVSLAGIEAIHADWQSGAPLPGVHLSPEQVRQLDLTPKTITAFLVGLKSKTAIFKMQRQINEFAAEPLLAILPGLTLQQLWSLMSLAENALLVVSGLVVLVSFTVMLAALLTGLNERRREMAILRAVGARPWQIFALVLGESLTLALAGAAGGLALLQGALLLAGSLLEARLGLTIAAWPPSVHELSLLAIVLACGLGAGLFPAWRAYRYSVADGMTIRI
ncbi:MAG TPA: ABC transporter permease [Candidatus Competibacteraceae bacterium]|nr:ABC transporter permease [Candidatus Competibacteraceae bacterium]HQD55028.1 ABC transporter permease [Candidatus Competibacteraceae bacterium]